MNQVLQKYRKGRNCSGLRGWRWGMTPDDERFSENVTLEPGIERWVKL